MTATTFISVMCCVLWSDCYNNKSIISITMHGAEDTTLGRAAHFNKAIECIAHTIDRLKHSAMKLSRHIPYIVISDPRDFLLQVTEERGYWTSRSRSRHRIWQSFFIGRLAIYCHLFTFTCASRHHRLRRHCDCRMYFLYFSHFQCSVLAYCSKDEGRLVEPSCA